MRTQITIIIIDKRVITTYFINIRDLIRDYYEQVNANKFCKLYDMDKFLEKYKLTKVDPRRI